MGRRRSHRPPPRYPRPLWSLPSINSWARVTAATKRGNFQDIITRPIPSARSAAVGACARPCRPRALDTPSAVSATSTAARCRTKAREPLPRARRWTGGTFSQATAVATRSHVCGNTPALNATPSSPVRPACTHPCPVVLHLVPSSHGLSPCRVPHLVLAR